MALDNTKNFAKVTVSTGYTSGSTSIVLTTGHGAFLPTAPFNLTWWNSTDYSDPSDDPNVEIVRCTAISTDTLTVTRAQESTSATSKNTSAKTYKMVAGLTAKVINTDLQSMGSVYWVPKGQVSGTIGSAANSIILAGMIIEYPIVGAGHLVVNPTTADNTNNSDFGIYTKAGALVAHTGAQHFGSTGPQVIAISGGGTFSTPAGAYYFAMTSVAATIVTQKVLVANFYQAANSGITSSGGALPGSITPPADVWNITSGGSIAMGIAS